MIRRVRRKGNGPAGVATPRSSLLLLDRPCGYGLCSRTTFLDGPPSTTTSELGSELGASMVPGKRSTGYPGTSAGSLEKEPAALRRHSGSPGGQNDRGRRRRA